MKPLLFLFILLFFLSGCQQDQGPTVEVEKGVTIPIKACVETNTKVLGNSVNTVLLCKCLIPKLYEDLKADPEKLAQLKAGNWADMSKDKQALIATYFQDCISQSATNDSTTKLTITPRMAEGIKAQIKESLRGSEMEKTNDVDKYCNCIIKSLQTDFTATEILRPNFNQTEKYQQAVDKCLAATRKN